MTHNEIEDGLGWGALVPTAAERREGSEVKRLGDRIVALTAERDDYILKQKVWEAANNELRSEHIRLCKHNEQILRALEILWEETKLAGNDNAKDYGWPKVREMVLTALSSAAQNGPKP